MNGMRMRFIDCLCYIEYRPKLGMFDVMPPYGDRYGHRLIPKRIHRTNDLFAAISSARHERPSC
jgi:hypothetical protein